MNTTQNPQGSTPRLDCGVVRIFRRWGFAWGGNFVNPDGQHFEYVGERRDLIAYPSNYCPNIVGGAVAIADQLERRSANRGASLDGIDLFGQDGFVPEESHEHR